MDCIEHESFIMTQGTELCAKELLRMVNPAEESGKNKDKRE